VGPVLDDDRPRLSSILSVVVGILKLAFSVAVDLALDLLVSERVGQRSVLVPVDEAVLDLLANTRDLRVPAQQ
jgi:hypothetical protein